MFIEVDPTLFFNPEDTFDFIDHEPTIADYSKFEEILVALKLFEAYKTGEKPWAIRIDDGPFEGSIFRLDTNSWRRSGLAHGIIGDSESPHVDHIKISIKQNSDVFYTVGIAGYLELDRYGLNKFVYLVTDEGKIYKELFYRAKKTVLLDYDGPTSINYTKMTKKESNQKKLPKVVQDMFGNTIEQGQYALYFDFENKTTDIVKFIQYKSARRVVFERLSNKTTFNKESFTLLKVDLDETSQLCIQITDENVCINNLSMQTLPILSLKKINGENEI